MEARFRSGFLRKSACKTISFPNEPDNRVGVRKGRRGSRLSISRIDLLIVRTTKASELYNHARQRDILVFGELDWLGELVWINRYVSYIIPRVCIRCMEKEHVCTSYDLSYDCMIIIDCYNTRNALNSSISGSFTRSFTE